MKNYIPNKLRMTFVIILFLCALTLLLSCGGKITTRPRPPKYQFTMNGVVVKDLNLGKDIAYFTVLRDSVAFDSAVIVLETASRTDTLLSQGGGVYSEETSHLFDFGHVVKISISSSVDKFNLTSLMFIPEYFYISVDTINPGGDPVPVDWSPSNLASGYILSLVTPDTMPPAVGYTDRARGTGLTIPREAFRTSGDDLVRGIYEVYVIAYYESFPEYPGMVFELPAGLPTDNLKNANGTIGAGVVAQKKHIRVP